MKNLKCPICKDTVLVEDEIQVCLGSDTITLHCSKCHEIFYLKGRILTMARGGGQYLIKDDDSVLEYIEKDIEALKHKNMMDALDDALVNDVCDRVASMKTHNCVYGTDGITCLVCGKTISEDLRGVKVYPVKQENPFADMSDEDLASFLKDIQSAKQVFNKTEWHDVNKELPEIKKDVLVYCEGSVITVGCIFNLYNNELEWCTDKRDEEYGTDETVLAWTELPEKPDWIKEK